MCIILVANIIWRSSQEIRSSFPLDFSSLHYSYSYVTDDRFGRALNGVTFWPPNRTFNAPKKKNFVS